MYSDKQKNEFALLRTEGVSFNSIIKKLNVPVRKLFRWAKDLSGDICDLKIAAYESVTDSIKASANKRIPENLRKCHSFVIVLSYFLSVIFYYVIVFSIP